MKKLLLILFSAVNGVSNQEAGSQKRIVCDKLTENFRAIDIAVKRIGEVRSNAP